MRFAICRSPDSPERREKLDTIRLIFINMHHLVNEHRPVQARDTLKHMMVKQNKEVKVCSLKKCFLSFEMHANFRL